MRVAIVEVGTTRAAGIHEGLAALDESDEESIGASVDAGVSAYVANGLAPRRIRPLLDLVNDPKQHPMYKVHPVQALARMCRNKNCSTDDRFAIIEVNLAAAGGVIWHIRQHF